MNYEPTPRKERIIIRIGPRHLSFASIGIAEAENTVYFEPYVVKSGMSMAANLREALKQNIPAVLSENASPAEHVSASEDIRPSENIRSAKPQRALVMLDAPVLLVPVEQFEEATMEDMYNQSFPHKEAVTLLYNVLPDLNAVAVFAINKDLKTVLDDNFADLRISPLMAPVWKHLHHRSFTGARDKLYGYFHDRRLEVFAFHQNRFKFYNQFQTNGAHDALYFLLYVWRQLMLDAEHDELHIVGNLPDEWLVGELRKYLQNAYVINPSAEFNRAPATKVKGLPFDLMALFTKGR